MSLSGWGPLFASCGKVISLPSIGTPSSLTGLPELVIHGLHAHDARILLSRSVPGRLDAHVSDRVVAETEQAYLDVLTARGRVL